MENSLSKNLKCIVMRNGIEIWMEADKAVKFQELLIRGGKGFVEVNNNLVNTADIVGIFTPDSMQDMTRRKNGSWKCQFGVWHDKGSKCDCRTPEQEEEFNKIKDKLGI